MKNTAKIKKSIDWWQSQPSLRQQSLCRLYLPTSNYLSLKRNEILFIYKSSEEPKKHIIVLAGKDAVKEKLSTKLHKGEVVDESYPKEFKQAILQRNI